jgi:hypothetical protein
VERVAAINNEDKPRGPTRLAFDNVGQAPQLQRPAAPLLSGRATQPRAELEPSGAVELNGTLSIQESYENSPSLGLFDFQGE